MFQLSNYVREISDAMSKHGWTPEAAVCNFVVNLNIMREHYDFGGKINFHEIGRDWVKLSSDERLSQRHSLIAKLTRWTAD